MAWFGKVLHQIHIAIGTTREPGTVFGLALGTKHKGLEFTTETKNRRSRQLSAQRIPRY
jgi:hypothetical protein